MRRRGWKFWVVRGVAFAASGLAGLADAGAQQAADPPADAQEGPRYRFIERYADPREDHRLAGTLDQYRVAFRQTIAIAQDRPRGTPIRQEITHEATYLERPARVSATKPGKVVSTVRRYESARSKPDPRPLQAGPWPLEGLTVWVHLPEGGAHQILSLTPRRRLRDVEFRNVYDQIAVTELPSLLPPRPIRKGDTWAVSQEGAELLLGAIPDGGELKGTLVEVRDDPKGGGGKITAVMEIAGRLAGANSEVGLRARVHFAYDPPPPGGGKAGGDTIDAVGAIVKLSMGQSEDAGLTARDDRLRSKTVRQLVLERRFGAGAEVPLLEIPDPPPKATPENSWITFADPNERFSFRHPQELRLVTGGLGASPDSLFLIRTSPELGDLSVKLFFMAKVQLKPDDAFRQIFKAVREERRLGLQQGEYRTLNWKGKRVLHKEATLKPPGPADAEGARAVTLDAYLIQFAQDASLIVEATTSQDPPADDRKEVEEMLKTFRVGRPPKDE